MDESDNEFVEGGMTNGLVVRVYLLSVGTMALVSINLKVAVLH